MGTPTQKKFADFFAMGYDWNAVVTIYTQSLNLYQMKSRKNKNKIVYTCERLESFVF